MWPFDQNKAHDKDLAEVDTIEDTESYKDDLPQSVKKNQKAMKRITLSDIRAKSLYDKIDNSIQAFRDIRAKIEAIKSSKKAPESADA